MPEPAFYVLYIADGLDDTPPADFWMIGPFIHGDAAVNWCEVHASSANWQIVRYDPSRPLHVETPEQALIHARLEPTMEQAIAGVKPRRRAN